MVAPPSSRFVFVFALSQFRRLDFYLGVWKRLYLTLASKMRNKNASDREIWDVKITETFAWAKVPVCSEVVLLASFDSRLLFVLALPLIGLIEKCQFSFVVLSKKWEEVVKVSI